MDRSATIARNIRLRIAMLKAHAPGWTIALARELAGKSKPMSVGGWGNYASGAHHASDAMLDRLALGLWLPRGGLLLLDALEVVGLAVDPPVDNYTANADSDGAR